METVVVTGAFSYTGRYATRMLLDRGYQVRTLTFHPERQNEFGNKVQAFSYGFDNQGQLEGTLRGGTEDRREHRVRA
jgi:nucleoside-diphosphate-sugar epimerase